MGGWKDVGMGGWMEGWMGKPGYGLLTAIKNQDLIRKSNWFGSFKFRWHGEEIASMQHFLLQKMLNFFVGYRKRQINSLHFQLGNREYFTQERKTTDKLPFCELRFATKKIDNTGRFDLEEHGYY